MKFYFSFILLFLSLSFFGQNHHYMLTGTYTRGKSIGIYVYDFNSADGSARVIDSVKTANPSYLAVAPGKNFVYAVNEEGTPTRAGKVRAYAFDQKTGKLRFLNEQSSMGDNPCYITVDKTGKWVVVGNYTSGTLAVLPIKNDGSVGEAVSFARHQGKGVNADRQEGPHVHSTVISPDNHFLFVPDLGIDQIRVYAFNEKTGKITPAKDSAVKLPDGSGPRHFDFHPNKKWAYLVQEMAGTVTAFNYQQGRLTKIQTISAVPEGFNQYFTSADIHCSPDGKFLYASTRDSANTIAIFKIDQQSGKLSHVGFQSTMGHTPRNFNFDPTGNFLLVANQNSDNIVVFRVDKKTGLLKDTGRRMDVGNPVCIKWAK